MKANNKHPESPRRAFLGSLAAGAASMGLASLAFPMDAFAAGNKKDFKLPAEADEWFNKLRGSHRIVFDATRPHEMMPFAWPRVFLMTNQATGSSLDDIGVIVVLRHDAIPYAFDSPLWEKYKFGEMFKANDPETEKPSVRNPFWKPKADAFKIPGFGAVPLGINELQADGVMFCVCDAAMTVYSAATAEQMGKPAADVKKEWMASLLPGIQVVPSGVWALGRAQEHKCGYIFAG